MCIIIIMLYCIRINRSITFIGSDMVSTTSQIAANKLIIHYDRMALPLLWSIYLITIVLLGCVLLHELGKSPGIVPLELWRTHAYQCIILT